MATWEERKDWRRLSSVVLFVNNKINTHSVKDFWKKETMGAKPVTVSMDFPCSIFSRNK